MRINKRIDLKYSQELDDFYSTEEYLEMYDALDRIIYSEKFTEEDFFDFFDYIAEKSCKSKQISNPFERDSIIRLQFVSTNMEEFFEDWDDDRINKYLRFFKNHETMMSLFDWPKPVFHYYKNYLNWNSILFNTFILEKDCYNMQSIEIIEELQRDIFIEQSNGLHVAAETFFFFLCYMKGVQFDFNFIKEALLNQSTQFATHIMFNDYIELNINDTVQGEIIILTHGPRFQKYELTLDASIEPLIARLAIDPEINQYIESVFNDLIV